MDDAQVIRRTKTNSICGLLFQMWLCFSLALMAYCLCGEVSIVISLFVPLLWTAYLIFRLNWVKSVCKKANLPQLIACALFAPIVFEINFLNVGDKTQYLADIICSPLGSTILRSFIQLIARGFLHLCVLSAIVFLFLNVFVFISPKIKAFYLSLSTREKRFLIIAAFIYIVLVFTFTHLTTLFTFSPVPDAVVYDKIYSLDTGGFLLDDAYTRILHAENDLRNPWFGIMSMPFGVIANLIARLFPHCTYAYTMSILFMQIIVIQISILIIGRLVSASDRNRMQFMLLMEVSFPVLLFSLNAEQYVFPTFWIILLVNAFVKEQKDRDLWYIAATGSISTSVCYFPLVFNFKNATRSDFLRVFWSLLRNTITVIVLSGTLTRIPSFYNDVYKFTSWGSGVAFSDKLLQLVNAAGLALLRPLGAPMIDANGIPRYNTAPVTGVDWIGVCVLVIIIISLIINRKNRFTWACGLCVLLSLIVELVIGWGAGTYSMVVYSYYFSWAYVALICMALFEIFKRYPKIQTVVFTALILVVSVVNFTELIKALSFGIEYYPFY